MQHELARIEDSDLAAVDAVRAALAQMTDLDEVLDYAARAQTAHFYYHRAKTTQDLANRANQIRVWAERRAGELVPQDESEWFQFARSIGTNTRTIRRWHRFSRAKPGLLQEVMDEIIRDPGDITITGVERRIQLKKLKRIERGIYQNYIGQYVIRWRTAGVSRQMVLKGDLSHAREHLLLVTGKAKPARVPPPDARREYIADAYDRIRVALQLLDRGTRDYSPSVRAHVEVAATALYQAEDALTRALRESRTGGKAA